MTTLKIVRLIGLAVMLGAANVMVMSLVMGGYVPDTIPPGLIVFGATCSSAGHPDDHPTDPRGPLPRHHRLVHLVPRVLPARA